jgi:hypothetical protein
MKQIDVDEIYRNIPQEEIPWNIEEPPKALMVGGFTMFNNDFRPPAKSSHPVELS